MYNNRAFFWLLIIAFFLHEGFSLGCVRYSLAKGPFLSLSHFWRTMCLRHRIYQLSAARSSEHIPDPTDIAAGTACRGGSTSCGLPSPSFTPLEKHTHVHIFSPSLFFPVSDLKPPRSILHKSSRHKSIAQSEGGRHHDTTSHDQCI